MLIAACGGPPKRSWDGQTFRDGHVAFSVPPAPAGWRPVDVTDGSLAYRDDAHGASILLNARCHRPDQGTPLVALTNHLVIGSTDRDVKVQETVPFDGREALHTRLDAKWDGVPVAFDIYVMKKDGCSYDFVYVGEPGGYAGGVPAFSAYIKGFRTLPGSGMIASGGPRG
ncbi:MAG: putative secreted protein [Labilithrix sp.]|nr:putative secreted protein [Labilithrix sp.]